MDEEDKSQRKSIFAIYQESRNRDPMGVALIWFTEALEEFFGKKMLVKNTVFTIETFMNL